MAIKISAPRHPTTGQFKPKSMPAKPSPGQKPMFRPGKKPVFPSKKK